MIKRPLPLISLLAYALVLFKVMVLKDMPNIRIGYLMINFGGTREGSPNFVPFRTIWPYLRGDGGLIIAGVNLLGNIGLLVPIGFILPFLFPNLNAKKALIWAVVSGMVIETAQVLLAVGIFDIDDVILNGLGVMLGFWFQRPFVRWFPTFKARAWAIIIALSVMVAAIYALGLFLQGGKRPTRPRPDVHVALPDSSSAKRNDATSLPDPCGGTGGTGRIVTVGAQEITIRSKKGVDQIIHFTKDTKIGSASGPATVTDLRAGQGVTIVTTDDSGSDHMVAALVLICNG